jgi:hypothetical protein
VAQAQSAMQALLARAGHAPADFLAKGKTLLALWVQKQAAVGAFEDAFVLAGLLITLGFVPALLIRNRHAAKEPGSQVMAE